MTYADILVALHEEVTRSSRIHPIFPTDPYRRLRILVEEVGEIAKASDPATIDYNNLRTELIQVGATIFRWLNQEDMKSETNTDMHYPRRAVRVGGEGGDSGIPVPVSEYPMGGTNRIGERGTHGNLGREADQDATTPNRVGQPPDEAYYRGRGIHPSANTGSGDRLGESSDRGGHSGTPVHRPPSIPSPTGTPADSRKGE